MSLRRRVHARLAPQLFQTDAQGNAAPVADCVARHFEQFPHQSHPIPDRAAVAVGAMIVFGQQKLVWQVAHAGIHVDDVESGPHGAARTRGLPFQKVADIARVHGPGTQIAHETHVGGQPRHAGRRQGSEPAGPVQSARPPMPKFDAGKGAMFMHRVRHQRMRADILVVPERRERQRRVVRARMDGHRARTHHAPPAFGLDPAKCGAHLRQRIGHSAGMRYLIKADRTSKRGLRAMASPRSGVCEGRS